MYGLAVSWTFESKRMNELIYAGMNEGKEWMNKSLESYKFVISMSMSSPTFFCENSHD